MSTAATDLRWMDFVVRYVDNNGRTKQKSFRTEDARALWIDSRDIQILAFSDPQ